MLRQIFAPGKTLTLAVTPESSSIALGREGGTVRIVNDGKVNVWIEFGQAGVTARPSASMLLTAGYTALVRMPAKTDHLAAVCPAKGAASLNITLGEGS